MHINVVFGKTKHYSRRSVHVLCMEMRLESVINVNCYSLWAMNLLLSNENIAKGLSVPLSNFQKILHAEVSLKRVCVQNRSCDRSCSMKKSVLRNFAEFTRKHLCQSHFFNKVTGLRPQASNFIKKETLVQVFSCRICEISRNTFFHRTPLVAASEILFMRGKFIFSTYRYLV